MRRSARLIGWLFTLGILTFAFAQHASTQTNLKHITERDSDHTPDSATRVPGSTYEVVVELGGSSISGRWIRENQSCTLTAVVYKDGSPDYQSYYAFTWNDNSTGQTLIYQAPNIGDDETWETMVGVTAVDSRTNTQLDAGVFWFDIFGVNRPFGEVCW